MEERLRALVSTDSFKTHRYLTTLLMDVEEYVEIEQAWDYETLLNYLEEGSRFDLYVIEIDEKKFQDIYDYIKERVESGESKLVVFSDNELYVNKAKEIIPEALIPDTLYFLGKLK